MRLGLKGIGRTPVIVFVRGAKAPDLDFQSPKGRRFLPRRREVRARSLLLSWAEAQNLISADLIHKSSATT
jgi:hypothetical protein